MIKLEIPQSVNTLLSFMLLIIMGIVMAFIMSTMEMTNALALGLGVLMFVLAFLKIEYALYFLIFSMLLSPEITFGAMDEQGVSGGRTVVVRLDDLFLILIAFGWLAKSALDKNVGLITQSPINNKIYAYTTVFVFATAAGILYGDVEGLLGVFNVLKYIEYFLLYFLVLNNIQSEKRARRLIRAALITSFIIAVYAIIQIPSGTRVSAPFEGKGGEPNTLGGYMLLMMSLSMGLFLETGNIYKRGMYALLSVVCLIALFYTESRSSYIGLLLSVIILTLLVKKRNILLFGAVLFVVFSSVILPSRVMERITYTFKAEKEKIELFQSMDDSERKFDSSTEARLQSWQEAWDGWKRYPILGWGVTGFTFMDTQYMKILVETGALGMLTFIMLMSSIGKNARKTINYTKGKDEFYRGISIGYFAGFIGLLGHALGTNTFIIIRIMEPFWLITAIVMSIPNILPESKEGDKPEEIQDKEGLGYFHPQKVGV